MAATARPKLTSRPQMRAGGRFDPNRSWASVTMYAAEGEAPARAELLVFGFIGQDTDPYTGQRVGVSAETVLTQLRAVGPNDAIDVRINSRGGDAFDGTAIHSFLAAQPGKVTVKIDGVAASAASLIAMAGDEIQIPGNAWMMIHNPSTFAAGDEDDLAEAVSQLKALKAGVVDAYAAKNSKMSADEIAAAMSATTWYTGQQAVDAGFADVCTTAVPVTNFAAHDGVDVDLKVYANAPEALINPPAPQMSAEEKRYFDLLEAAKVELAAKEQELVDARAKLAGDPPAPEPEPAPEPKPEDEAARLAREASEKAVSLAAEADRVAFEKARGIAVKHGLVEMFDDLASIGATTEKLMELVVNGGVAMASKAPTMSISDPTLPPQPAAKPSASIVPTTDPHAVYAAMNSPQRN